MQRGCTVDGSVGWLGCGCDVHGTVAVVSVAVACMQGVQTNCNALLARPHCRCTCYTNCALWRDHPYALVHALEYSEERSSELVAKVLQEVQATLAEVALRIERSTTR